MWGRAVVEDSGGDERGVPVSAFPRAATLPAVAIVATVAPFRLPRQLLARQCILEIVKAHLMHLRAWVVRSHQADRTQRARRGDWEEPAARRSTGAEWEARQQTRATPGSWISDVSKRLRPQRS